MDYAALGSTVGCKEVCSQVRRTSLTRVLCSLGIIRGRANVKLRTVDDVEGGSESDSGNLRGAESPCQ
eukprot:904715-Prorocentrum_minimum.AAC.3